MGRRDVILLNDIDHPDHSTRVAGNRESDGVSCFPAGKPFAPPAGVATVAQFALLEVRRFDDIVGAGVAGSAPRIHERQPRRPHPSYVFQAAGRHKKGTRHSGSLAKAVS